MKGSVLTSICLTALCFSCMHRHSNVLHEEGPFAINVESFGAVADDGIDDSDAIADAIKFALSDESNGSVIQFNGGTYDLEKPIHAFKWNVQNENFDMVSLTLKGPIPCYSPSRKIGVSTVLKKNFDGATIVLQRGRNCRIENFTFVGELDKMNDPVSILSASFDLSKDLSFQYSPRCAVVIDPFHKDVPEFARYDGHDKYYKNNSRGGSSMISIKGCSFVQEDLCIAVNPSNGVQNGENIIAEECHVQRCDVFWASGQTQSRGNVIRSVYGYLINTFIDCTLIGKKIGTPPLLSNLNLAGFVRNLAKIDTRFSGFSVSQSYFESMWSLGSIRSNFISFSQTQMKFVGYSKDFFAPPYHLQSNAVCTFRDCSIEFFSNCKEKSPILFNAPSVLISGGWIESGLVAASGYYNSRGGSLHNVDFDNVYLKCQESIVNGGRGPKSLQQLNNRIFLGQCSLESLDGARYYNPGTTFSEFYFDEVEILVDSASKELKFRSPYARSLNTGDCLFGLNTINYFDSRRNVKSMRSYLGYVSEINNDIVKVRCVPEGTTSGKTVVYCVEYPIFIVPVWGNISKGSNVVTSITSPLGLLPEIGTRIYHPMFSRPAIVRESNTRDGELLLSESSKQNGSVEIISVDYNQIYDTYGGDISGVEFLKTRANVVFRKMDGRDINMSCIKGGIPTRTSQPVLVRK